MISTNSLLQTFILPHLLELNYHSETATAPKSFSWKHTITQYALFSETCEYSKCTFPFFFFLYALLFCWQKRKPDLQKLGSLAPMSSAFQFSKPLSGRLPLYGSGQLLLLISRAVLFYSDVLSQTFLLTKIKTWFLTSQTCFIVFNSWPGCTITPWNKSTLNHI